MSHCFGRRIADFSENFQSNGETMRWYQLIGILVFLFTYACQPQPNKLLPSPQNKTPLPNSNSINEDNQSKNNSNEETTDFQNNQGSEEDDNSSKEDIEPKDTDTKEIEDEDNQIRLTEFIKSSSINAELRSALNEIEVEEQDTIYQSMVNKYPKGSTIKIKMALDDAVGASLFDWDITQSGSVGVQAFSNEFRNLPPLQALKKDDIILVNATVTQINYTLNRLIFVIEVNSYEHE